MSDSNPYTSRKINTLAPTDGIKDPQVRSFCDSLANVWQLRNGNIGFDDKERFITKQEWDYLAKNPNIRALAGIGQPGSSTNEPGPGDGGVGGGPIPPWIQNIVDFLQSGITLIDFAEIRKTSNELWASIYALTTDVRGNINRVTNDLSGLEDDITQINTIDSSSTSKSAQTLFAVKETTETSSALIAEINNVSVTSTSANAQKTALLEATVNNPENGNLANTAAIIQINTVDATTTSANAKQLMGLSASVGYDKVTGKAVATADIAALNTVDVNSSSANARTTAGLYAQFNNPDSGLGAAFAAINAINNVDANSTSASARTLAGTVVGVGLKARVFVQATPPPEISGVPPNQYTVKAADIWLNTSDNNKMMVWNPADIPGSPGPPVVPPKLRGWIDGSDTRLAAAMGGVTNEATVRATSDNVNASATNTVWGLLGDGRALVQEGSTITLTPGVANAAKWTAVQSEVMDYSTTPPTKIVSAVRQDLKTEVDLQARRANAGYTLKVEADAGTGVKAIAGMSLTAHVEGTVAETACVFSVDVFGIFKPGVTATWMSPFYIGNDSIVRMNVAYIRDRVQSDTFTPADSATDGYGWRIKSDGSAEFYGATTMAKLLTGSVLLDNDSRQPISSVAVGSWSAKVVSGTGVHTISGLRFYGPDWHNQTSNPSQRLRQTARNNTNMTGTAQFVGVADDRVTIWARYANSPSALGGAPWQAQNSTTTPTADYNAVTCAWSSSTIGMQKNGCYEFGVSCTDASGQPLDPSKTDLRDFTLSVAITNF